MATCSVEPGGGLGLLALECAPRGLIARLREPRLVGKSVEHVHACDRPGGPARGAVVPGPAVDSHPPWADTCGRKALRAAVLACAGLLLPECCERHIGPVRERLGFERGKLGGVDERDGRSRFEQEDFADRFAHHLIKARASDTLLGRRQNLLFTRARHVHVELQNVGIRDEPGISPVAGKFPIGECRLDGRIGRPAGAHVASTRP